MNYALLRSVLDALEAYEASQPNGETDLAGFSAWLTRVHTAPAPAYAPASPNPGHSPHVMASRLLAGLYGYAKNYSRRALEGTPLQSIEEFTYLAVLLESGALTKTALINLHTHGKTSGMDIIRRLHVLGLVEETDNPEDKRSKVVSITDLGKITLFQAFGKMNAAALLVVEPLEADEKMLLLHLLRKLDIFHKEMIHHRKDELDERLGDHTIVNGRPPGI